MTTQATLALIEQLRDSDAQPGQLTDRAATLRFLFGNKAVLTVVSERTGQRYTFKVQAPRTQRPGGDAVYFVSLLAGPDNMSDYQYVGTCFVPAAPQDAAEPYTNARFRLTAKSRLTPDSGPVRAFGYLLDALVIQHRMPAGVIVYHEGRCGRCGRRLTVPESITSGFGPECVQIMAGGR